jgi:predicted nucleotidyltransferase
MTAEEQRIVQKIRETGHKVVPEGGQVWLYGSRARGEARAGSDWDLLILLNQPSVTTEDEEKIAYPFVVEGWKNNVAVSPQLYTFEEWRRRSFTPYYKNVENDKLLIR